MFFLFWHYFWNFLAAAFWESDSKEKFPVPANRVESVFIFCKILWNKIPKVPFYFCSMERNSELFSLPWNGSERNSIVCIYYCSMERNSENDLERSSKIFCFAEHLEFRQNKPFVSSIQSSRNYFLSEIPQPMCEQYSKTNRVKTLQIFVLQYELHCEESSSVLAVDSGAGIFKLIRSPRIDSKEPIPPGFCSPAGRYDNPIPTRFLAPIDG
jgi:hypothetical protein